MIQYTNSFNIHASKIETIHRQKIFGRSGFKDLNKTFNTISHQSLPAKLHAYGFTKQDLAVMCYQKQGIKSNNVFGS